MLSQFGSNKLVAVRYLLLVILCSWCAPTLALPNCVIQKSEGKATLESLIQLENCTVVEIFNRNKLDRNTFTDLVIKSANFFPQTHLILNFERAFRDDNRPFYLLEAFKESENFHLKKELASVFFNQFLTTNESKEGFVKLSQLLGQESAEKIIDALLSSDKDEVVINTSNLVSKLPNETSTVLRIKAKSALLAKARDGDAIAMTALLRSGFLDWKESSELVYGLIKDYPDHSIDHSLAGLAMLYIKRMPASKVDSGLIKRLLLKSAKGSITAYAFMRALFSITEDPQFEFDFPAPLDAETDFEKCIVKAEKDFFDCLFFVPNPSQSPLEAIYYMGDFSLAVEHFHIKFDKKFSDRLISRFYDREHAFELKKEFTDMIFLGLLSRDNERSTRTWNMLARMKIPINEFVWVKHIDQIISSTENGVETFPILNEYDDSTKTFSGFFQPTDDQRIGFTQKFKIDLLLSKIDVATSQDFFSQLGLIIYKLYMGSDFSTGKIENLVDRSAKRVGILFGKDTKLYDGFLFHKLLIGSQTGTIETVSFIIEQIERAKRFGLEIDKWEDQLISSYSAAGKYEEAKRYTEQRVKELISERNEHYEKAKANKSNLALEFDTQICLGVTQLNQIRAHLKEETNYNEIIKYCFNDFNYSSNNTPLLGQYDAFKLFAGSNTLIFGDASTRNPKEIQQYLNDLLQDEAAPLYFKPPFAFVALLLTTDKSYQEYVRKKFLVREVYQQFPKIILESEQVMFEFYEKMSESLVARGEESVTSSAQDLLEFAETNARPSLNQPFASNSSFIESTKYPPEKFKMALEMANYSDAAIQMAFIAQQHLKFGPSEQLLLRHSVLGDDYSKKVSTLLLKREVLVEKIISERESGTEIEPLTTELAEINRGLTDIGKANVFWEEIYPKILDLNDHQKNDVLYLDFRHHPPTNTIGVFHLEGGVLGYKVIGEAKKLAEMTTNLVRKLKTGDQSFVIEASGLAKNLVTPFVTNNTKKILIAPHSFLFAVPYDALLVGPIAMKGGANELAQNSRGVKIPKSTEAQSSVVTGGFENFLGIRYEVALVSNIVRGTSVSKEGKYEFFGIGDPVFNGKKSEQSFAFNLFQNNPLRSAISISQLPALPETRAELEAFSKSPIFSKSTLLTGREATKKNILDDQKLRRASVISFATHGLANGQMSEYSLPGLALTPGAPSKSEDNGFLSMMDVLGMEIVAELVILSACETGSARSIHSPPFSGLAASFLASGAQHVLASLWPVYSEATTKLMVSIGKNKTKDNSWLNAKKNGIKEFVKGNPEYANPVFWAPFVMYTSVR